MYRIADPGEGTSMLDAVEVASVPLASKNTSSPCCSAALGSERSRDAGP